MIDVQNFLLVSTLLISILILIHLLLKRKIRTSKLRRWFRSISDSFHEHQLLKVPEFNDIVQENQLYRRVSTYVNTLESLEDSNHTNLFSGASKPTDIILALNPNQTIEDDFLGARVWWTNQVRTENDSVSMGGCERAFVLKLRKRDKRRILRPYLQHIHTVAEEIEQRRKEVRLFTNIIMQSGGISSSAAGCKDPENSNGGGGGGRWISVPLTHPATVDTIAMDGELKIKIKSDLEAFLKSKQYYHRLGRVWRRSYLLYGPSGTGKSSFVTAMAKFLSYDVYDVDLSKVSGDSDLKMLLLQTTTRSVILIEDFDKYVCTNSAIHHHLPPPTISLSGILNFMDGVVNSCCDERVMVFTMTTKDHIDPVLLRPGRIDVHIYFPLCDFNSFKNLASNYLGVTDHKLFPHVEEMFLTGATLSPAEIGELMIVNRNSPSRAFKSVITALQVDGVRTREREKNGRRISGGGGGGDRDVSVMESVDESVDSVVGVGCKDGVKELRKFYGFLRRKSIKKSESFDLRR